VLKRAAELFARFTHHRYDLRFETDGEALLMRAVETSSGQGRSLDQLSDGTRVQLLLAARLAFAGRLDREAALPLFLDEVLTTSDPLRFDAIAQSLRVMVEEEGRQVFYLTSNPADAARWNAVMDETASRPVRAIDLAEVRGLEAAAKDGAELVAPLRQPPSPVGLDAAEYGLELQVPPVEPRRSAGALDLFHLLHDDLQLVHRLRLQRIETVGQWRDAAAKGAVAFLDAAVVERVSALADLAEAFVGAWRIGRGRRIDREVLGAAGVSETYLDRIAELAGELEGDAARLVEAIESRSDERAKGFQKKKLEQLVDFLAAEGYLDTRDVLDEAALSIQVLEGVSPHVREGRLTETDLATIVSRLYRIARG
jgi:hypothetical protein